MCWPVKSYIDKYNNNIFFETSCTYETYTKELNCNNWLISHIFLIIHIFESLCNLYLYNTTINNVYPRDIYLNTFEKS